MIDNNCEYPGCNKKAIHNIVHPKTDLIFETCELHREDIIQMITTKRKKRRLFIQESLLDDDFKN